MDQPGFFFDLGSPGSYLVSERVLHALPELAEWVPVAWGADRDPDWEALEVRASSIGLLPLRHAARWPPDTGAAMRAATYAKQGGKTVAFCQAAFRQAFAGGQDLSNTDTLLLAGAAAEIHPRALLKGIETAGVERALASATAAARDAGVTQVPALVMEDGTVYEGEDCLEAATRARLRTSNATTGP